MQEEFLTQPMGDESSAILAMGEFQRLKPPTFSGEPDPLIAEEWLARVTKILDTLQIVEDNLRVSFAVLQLQGDASKWWEYERNTVSGEWEAFTKAFLEKYFPEVTKDALREEFEKLIQKNMSVMQYEARFTTLSRFASELVENEDLKAKRFERGLKTTIRLPVEALKLCTYNDIVERAIIVEEALRNSRRIWESRSLSQDSQIENRSGKKAKVTSPSSLGSGKSSDPGKSLWEPRSCHHCGQLGHFRKECPLREGSGSCHHCGQLGHFRKECPLQEASEGVTERAVIVEEALWDSRRIWELRSLSQDSQIENHSGKKAKVASPSSQGSEKSSDPGKSLWEPRSCHHCGQLGHFRKTCPLPVASEGVTERALIVEEALWDARRIWELRSLSQDSQLENRSGKKAKVTSPSSQGLAKSSDPGKSVWEPGSCHHCGQLGHFRKECPLREASGSCHHCGQLGHFRKECPLREASGSCHHCGQLGHFRKECPLQEASEGVTESLQSHVSRRSLRRPTVCFHCGHMGHLKRDCPQTG